MRICSGRLCVGLFHDVAFVAGLWGSCTSTSGDPFVDVWDERDVAGKTLGLNLELWAPR